MVSYSYKTARNRSNKLNEQLGKLAKLARQADNLTQVQLSEKIGVTQSRISQLESADDEKALSTLAEIVIACGGELQLTFEHKSLEKPAVFRITLNHLTQRKDNDN